MGEESRMMNKQKKTGMERRMQATFRQKIETQI